MVIFGTHVAFYQIFQPNAKWKHGLRIQFLKNGLVGQI